MILSRDSLAVDAGVIVPAAGGRTVFVLPWLGRTLVGTTDNDYEERDSTTCPPRDADVEYLLEAVNALLRHRARRGRPDGRLRGGAPADLHRRPEEVGGHLAQGRALRDQLRARDDHRRQAHHLAADGQDGGGPARGARGPRGALPHARDPARAADRAGAAARGRERGRGHPRAPGGPLRPRRARRAGAGRHRSAARPAGEPRPARHRRGGRLRGRREQALSLADVLLRRTRLGLLDARGLCAPDAEGPRVVARAMAGQLGWDEARVQRELAAWHEVASAEGLVPQRWRWGRASARPRRPARPHRRSPRRPRPRSRRRPRPARRPRRRRDPQAPRAWARPLQAGADGDRERHARLVLRRQRPKDPDELAALARKLVEDGAALIDVGGESGRTDTERCRSRRRSRACSRSWSGWQPRACRCRWTRGAARWRARCSPPAPR